MKHKESQDWKRKATTLMPMRDDGSSAHCYETRQMVQFYVWPKFGNRECVQVNVPKRVLRKLVRTR